MGQPYDPNRQPAWAPPPTGSTMPTGPLNAPVPSDRQSPYAPSAAPPPKGRKPWAAMVVGLVAGLVIAVVVDGVLVATKALHFGSTTASVNTAPISLPASLPGYQDLLAASSAKAGASLSADKKATLIQKQKDNQTKVKSLTIAAYQQAYGGAAVDAHTYSDADLMHFVTVIAVRAKAPGLTLGPVSDPAYLGLAVSQQQVVRSGEVDCEMVQTMSVPAGQTPEPKNVIYPVCQRTADGLTVQVFGGSMQGAEGQQTMIALVNDAWAAVNG